MLLLPPPSTPQAIKSGGGRSAPAPSHHHAPAMLSRVASASTALRAAAASSQSQSHAEHGRAILVTTLSHLKDMPLPPSPAKSPGLPMMPSSSLAAFEASLSRPSSCKFCVVAVWHVSTADPPRHHPYRVRLPGVHCVYFVKSSDIALYCAALVCVVCVTESEMRE